MYEIQISLEMYKDKIISINIENDIYSYNEIIKHAESHNYKVSIFETIIILYRLNGINDTEIKLFKRMGEQKWINLQE